MNMNKTDAYSHLRDAFLSTFLDELIPGIFHNFANPLNGIMGRSQLMQRRLADLIEKLRALYPEMDAEMDNCCKKLLSDINMINKESEKFYDLFRLSTGKFYAIGVHDPGRVNLSSLVEAEMGFADFYLDFKHDIKKDIRIDREMPDIDAIRALYSMAVWALIQASIKTIAGNRDTTFTIATDHEDRWVSLSISPIGIGILSGDMGTLVHVVEKMDQVRTGSDNGQDLLMYALHLLKTAHAGVQITHNADTGMLTVRIPLQSKTKAG
jgi:signal transduction histidine kinase